MEADVPLGCLPANAPKDYLFTRYMDLSWISFLTVTCEVLVVTFVL